uniref:Uncharacterized protein n=1 Tax=Plectus sambesii TaxID=2011161 RepID=A0A914XBN3_9BILA
MESQGKETGHPSPYYAGLSAADQECVLDWEISDWEMSSPETDEEQVNTPAQERGATDAAEPKRKETTETPGRIRTNGRRTPPLAAKKHDKRARLNDRKRPHTTRVVPRIESLRVPINRAHRPYCPVADPSVCLIGDATACMISREFVRSSDGVTHLWLPGEPAGAQLIEMIRRGVDKPTSNCICILLSRHELLLSESVRKDKYHRMVQLCDELTQVRRVSIITPLPYPGVETLALKAAVLLREECHKTKVALLELSEQFLVGKTARPELFRSSRLISPLGVRHVALFLRDRGGFPLPPLASGRDD